MDYPPWTCDETVFFDLFIIDSLLYTILNRNGVSIVQRTESINISII